MAANPYDEHINYFGSPQAYASEITRKETAGESFSDLASAQAFKQAYPQYFQQSIQQPQPQQPQQTVQPPPQGSQWVQQPQQQTIQQQPQQTVQAKPYQAHLDWFVQNYGGAQSYADTIKQKMASGTPLDDQAAAQAFMQDYPQYFQQQQPQQPVQQNQQQFETPYQVQEIQESPYASQVQSLMSQLQSQVNQPFNYNPQSDPAYQSMVQSVTQSVAEQMASRGILNSTVTRDQVAQSISQAVPQLMQFAYQRYQGQINSLLSTMSNLMKMDNDWQSQQRQARQDQFAQKKHADEMRIKEYVNLLATEKLKVAAEKNAVQAALNKVKSVGYVDNQSSVILGIPVGTPSYQAEKDARDRILKLQMKEMDIESAMQRTQVQAATSMSNNASSNAAAMSRTQFTQGQLNQRQKNTQIAKTYADQGMFDPNAYNENAPIGGDIQTGESQEYVSGLVAQAREKGMSDEEIASLLEEDGIDPAEYGL